MMTEGEGQMSQEAKPQLSEQEELRALLTELYKKNKRAAETGDVMMHRYGDDHKRMREEFDQLLEEIKVLEERIKPLQAKYPDIG